MELAFWLLHIFQTEQHKYVKITEWVILTMPETVGLWVILFIYLKKGIRIQDQKSKGLCLYLKGLPWCLPVFCASCFADVTKIWKLKISIGKGKLQYWTGIQTDESSGGKCMGRKIAGWL